MMGLTGDKTQITQSDGKNLAAGETLVQVNIDGIDPEVHAEILADKRMTEKALQRLWDIVQDNPSKIDDPVDAILELVDKYKNLLARIEDVENNSPAAARLKAMAKTALDEGRLADAEGLINQAAEMEINEGEAQLNSAAESYAELAELKRLEFDFDSGAEYYKKAALIVPRSDSYSYGMFRNKEALMLDDAGHYDKSLIIMQEIVALFEGSLKSNDPNLAMVINNLATLYQRAGRHVDAEPLFARALEIAENVFGFTHDKVAICLNNLGLLFSKTERLDEAEKVYKRALEIDKKVLAPEHPNIAIRLNNLGSLYVDMNRDKEAELLFKQALEIDEAFYGRDHSRVAQSLSNLAVLYDKIKSTHAAELHFKRAIVMFKNHFGEGHPNIKHSMENYCMFLKQQGREDEIPGVLAEYGIELEG